MILLHITAISEILSRQIYDGKVHSIHWLENVNSGRSFVTTGPDGHVVILCCSDGSCTGCGRTTDITVSQGSVATHLRCGGPLLPMTFKDQLINLCSADAEKFLVRLSVVLILNKQKSFKVAFENVSRESRISKVVC